MNPTAFFRRFATLATLLPLAVLPAAAQDEDAGTGSFDDPPPFEVPDVSEADFPFAPPEGIADFVPIHQLELEEHPDPVVHRRSTKATRRSVLQPRATAIAGGARVLGWHPYWADSSDYLSYDYSNLTHIAYFSAEVNAANGEISNLHNWSTDPVIPTAHSNGVKVILTATLFGESGNHKLLTNNVACTNLAAKLVTTVVNRGGDGICIDFESVGSWSGATKALTSFMSNLVAKAHAVNPPLEVSICLPSVDWYADFAVGEYEKIGVDYSIIMGYDYYYAGSATPGPVAPLRSSAQWQGASSWCSVDYSTRYYLNKMTNAAHLMLAVPYYGRRWKAATTNLGAKSAGSSYSAAVTYPNAAAAAETHGRKWDSNGSVPYYTYKSGTNAYQCFYDDAQSLGLKYDYAKEKGLGGVGIWCLTHAPESEELWNLLGTKLGAYTPPGVTIPSTASGPAAIATGVNADSALFSWTPATEDPAGYVIQFNGHWEPASGLFSNSFSSAEGWGSFTNASTNIVTVSGATWKLYNARVRAALASYSDTGYVFLDNSTSWIQAPPIVGGTVTQVTARIRAANTNYLDSRKVAILASTNSGVSWQVVGNCPANSYTNIIDYPFTCSLQSASGVLLMVSNSTAKTVSGPTVLLHQLTADFATSNWVATSTTVTDTCATNLTGLSSPTDIRVRNASSTNWSDIVSVFPGMVPSNLAAVPGDDGTSIDVSWTAAANAAAYQVDVASGPYTNWTSTCPAASLGTNKFLSGQTWCYTGTVSQKASSTNLSYGPGYCAVNTNYLGHYLVGCNDQALQSWDFPLYGATCANLSFSNCPWNAKKATCGITTSVLRVYYRLDAGPWNFLGECRASSVTDEVWSAQSFTMPYLDGESLAVRITAPYAEFTTNTVRGAGLKNIQLSFSGTTGRYCDANRPEGYPKTVTSPSDTIEGLTPETPYWIRVQALTENTRSVWAETTAATTEDTGGDQPSTEITPVTTTWDFTVPEGWSVCTNSLYNGATNVNGHTWNLSRCYVRPSEVLGGDTGQVYLYQTNSCAVSPAFFGVVTQVITVFRPASTGDTRQVTLLVSTNGGESFSTVAAYPLTDSTLRNYTNSFAFAPPLDGGDSGIVFCATNSGVRGSIQWRRLTIEGTSTAPEEPDADSWSPFGTSTAEQPHGALSGIVLYLSAGHGFTANATTNAWATGRGLAYGMVEDMGTLDQLNYFALQAWKAGATIVPMRPLGYQTNEVVIDNVDTASTLASRVTYGGNWGNTSQKDFYYGKVGEVGYRWANTCATGTTAWASYRPDLPVAGEYPVYVWARPGSDRVPQLYRVHHAGGVTDVRVDHRQVGNGWVWIGNYWFGAGTDGCVNISNYAPGFPGRTVIADAVRFGNGMGDISRGKAGISKYERELEGARYWTQRMVMDSQGLSATIYDSCTTKDQDDNVSAPNRMAYAMCRTDKDDDGWTPERWRRLYLSFHSNASGSQRGCMGLYDTRLSAGTYLAGQTNLARCIANSIVSNMTAAHAHGRVATAWQQDCSRVLGGTYGEIYGGGIYTKMDNTIAEVAFHDKEKDAAIMKSPTGREWLARSCLRGVLRHFVTRYASDSSLTVREISAPEAPVSVAATNSGLGCVTVAWKMPVGTNVLADHHTGFVVYVSTNGYAFGNPVAISSDANEYKHKFTDLPAGNPYYFRVCATNAGGESLPSPVAGAGLSTNGATADVLVVDGFRRNDGSQSPTRYFANNLSNNVTLVRPRMINSFDYVKEHGNAIAAAGCSFDFMDAARVTSTDLARYPKVVWCLGEESTADETFSYDEQQLVSSFLANGGCLFVSGSEIGWDLSAKGSAADKAFFSNCLHCAYVKDDAGTGTVGGKTGTFLAATPFEFNYTNSLPDIYAAEYPDVLAPVGDAFVAAAYGGASGTNGAVIAFSNATYRTVVMGFPFETITDAGKRNKVMKKVLEFFNAEQAPPEWIGPTNYVTGYAEGIRGEVEIDLKSQVTGFPSPAVTLLGTLAPGGGEIDTDAYAIAEDRFYFRAPGLGDYAFTFLVQNAAETVTQKVVMSVGRAPVWQPIGDMLVDLDTEVTNNLYPFVSGEYPAITRDEAHCVAVDGTFLFEDNYDLVIHSAAPVTNVFAFVASNGYGTASVTFTNIVRRLDTDDDGIPDWWAIQYFGGATACNPNADPDGDGFTNYQEYRLGTDPTDPDSYFHLEAETNPSTAETYLVWPTATGMTYTLWFSTNLLLGTNGATVIESNLPATTDSWQLVPTNPATFFWVTSNPAP
jgi:spore germination protein YaaH